MKTGWKDDLIAMGLGVFALASVMLLMWVVIGGGA